MIENTTELGEQAFAKRPMVTFVCLGMMMLGSTVFYLWPKDKFPHLREAQYLSSKYDSLEVGEAMQTLIDEAGPSPNPPEIFIVDEIVYLLDSIKDIARGHSYGSDVRSGEDYEKKRIDEAASGSYEYLSSEDGNGYEKLSRNQKENYQNANPEYYNDNSNSEFGGSGAPDVNQNSSVLEILNALGPELTLEEFNELLHKGPSYYEKLLEEKMESCSVEKIKFANALIEELEKLMNSKYQPVVDEADESLMLPNLGGISYQLGITKEHTKMWSYVIHPFFSSSILFLLLNLMAFYSFAPLLEGLWGRSVMVIFLVGAAAFTGFIYQSGAIKDFLPFIGPLGLVSVVLAAAVVHFPTLRLSPLQIITFGQIQGMKIQLWYCLPLWFLFWYCYHGLPAFIHMVYTDHFRWLPLEGIAYFISGATEGPSYTQYSMVSIYSGFALGLFFAGIMRVTKFYKIINPSEYDKMTPKNRCEYLIQDALDKGDKERAREILSDAAQEFPDDMDIQMRYWQQLLLLNEAQNHKGIGLRILTRLLKDGSVISAYETWLSLRSLPGGSNIPIKLLLDLSTQLIAEELKSEAREFFGFIWQQVLEKGTEEQILELFRKWQEVDSCEEVLSQAIALPRLSATCKSQLQQLSQMRQPKYGEPVSLPADILSPLMKATSAPADSRPIKIRSLHRIEVELVQVKTECLKLNANGSEREFTWDQIKGLGFVVISPLDGEPFALLDLFLNDPFLEAERHRVIRISSRRLPQVLLQKFRGDGTRALQELSQFACKVSGLSSIKGENGAALDELVFFDLKDFESMAYGIAQD